ncbi:hypothetical protein M409DRAFT_53197 [Zasmidium cellare ATCC 36951]|uniref:Uncharacterized protein n=1 Tax=Zasmidium cellare ATCC 36951 TaxID=1080233 RepID=A0A6A6CMQ3_ZASCE|nr:uncharacterized protein M409DRAFT_53197 [Zasmidium cellare ATCC 36951]KAF2168537.1 hypothetical protein M409DRAFT_53197 [Zasmidium cellare ATCC 36951]
MSSSLAAQVCRSFGECEDAWPRDWLNSTSPSRSLPREIIQLRTSLDADFVPTKIEYENTVKRMFLEIVDTAQEYTKRKLFGLAAEEEIFRLKLGSINIEYDRSYIEILSNLSTDLDSVSGALVAVRSDKTYQISRFLKEVDPLLISLRSRLKKLVRLKDDICDHRHTDLAQENNTILRLPKGLVTFSGHANNVYRMLQERDCLTRTRRVSQFVDATSSSGQSQLNTASSWLHAPEAAGQGNMEIEERSPIKNICVHLTDERKLEGILQDSNDSYSVKVASPGKVAGASGTPGPRMATLESVLAHSLHPQPYLAKYFDNDWSDVSADTADQPAQSLGDILSRLFPVRSSWEPHRSGTLLSRLFKHLAWPAIPSDRESRHAINEVLSEIESDYGYGLGSALRWCLETQTSDANDLSWRAAMQAKVVEPLKALSEITSTALRTTEFDMTADQLKDALKRSTMVCPEPIRQTPTHRFDFDVGFCPRGALESLVRHHEDLLKILYMQTARSSVSEGSISHDSDLQKATEANSFFAGLMKRPHFWQVLASLIYSKTTPSSKMWLATWSRFTSACRNVQEHFEIFTEKSLPFDNVHLETLFHESSTDIVLFRTMQYMFCAATLEQDCQLENILVTYEDDPETGQRRPHQHPRRPRATLPRRVLVQTRGDPYFPNAAPEARIGDGLVGASSDVWAFGTVLAQYLAWLYGGNEALEDLRARLLKDYSDMTFFRVIRPPENSASNGGLQSNKGADEDASLTTGIAQEYAVVKEQALAWFDDRMAGHSELSNCTGTHSADQTRLQDTLFAACWKLLREKVLICDHRHRAQIEDVCEELSRRQQALGVGKGSL